MLAISPNANKSTERLDASSKRYNMPVSSFSMVANCFLAVAPLNKHYIALVRGVWFAAKDCVFCSGGTLPVSVQTRKSSYCVSICWLIDHVGPTRTLVVTYLLPCMALVYGALLLHEAVGLNSIAGLILILSGVFLTGRKTTEQAISFDEQSHSRVKL